MPEAVIILADGFEEIEAITCIDLIRRSNTPITILGLNSLEIKGSHEIQVKADLLLEDYSKDFDVLILPGGLPGTTNLAQSSELIDLIKKSFSENRLCAAICAAPVVLAKAGVLKGLKATCYPGFEDKLGEAIYTEETVVHDANVITSRGAGTAVPFALKIIQYICGNEVADTIASNILYQNLKNKMEY